MQLRKMTIQDIPAIVELEKILFSSPWSSSDFQYELQVNPFSKLYILEKQEDIVGYIGYWLQGDQTQITTVGIVPSEQGNGYAHLLMAQCIQETREKKYQKITLEVRVSNHKAISLYEKEGFVIVAIRKNYYQDTKEDAYLMLKEM